MAYVPKAVGAGNIMLVDPNASDYYDKDYNYLANAIGSLQNSLTSMNTSAMDAQISAMREANAFTASQNRQAQEFEAMQAELNRQFQQSSADKQMEFQKMMSDTAYQRAVEDMKKAGINPILAYTQGGANSASGASASGSVAYGHTGSSAMANVASAKQADQELGLALLDAVVKVFGDLTGMFKFKVGL